MCLKLIAKTVESGSLKDFQTRTDLEAWFELHKELRMPAPNLCDDYSDETIHLAEADGHHADRCLVFEGKTYATMISKKQPIVSLKD